MKTLHIPLLHGLEEQDIDSALELGGEHFSVDHVNWPAEYPYAPLCAGRIARTEESLLVDFRVSGLDLRVQNLADCGRSWEDSCVELFLQVPGSDVYYNFESNPAGRLTAACGTGRNDRKPPVNEPMDYKGGIWNWRVLLIIPFEVLGLDEAPASLKGNIYKCGDLTAHPHFVSWAPVGTPAPDFHRPEYFGEFELN